jgi:hypothetical protein
MILRWFLNRLNHSDVGDGRGDVFFRRYDVLKTRWLSLYLHEFFRSDSDRCLHDHPWWFWTLILRAGYWEIVKATVIEGSHPPRLRVDDLVPGQGPTCRVWRPVGYLGRYPAEHAHRIEIEPGTRPWSLVLVGKKVRPWGFWGPKGWIKWIAGHPNPICDTEGRTT